MVVGKLLVSDFDYHLFLEAGIRHHHSCPQVVFADARLILSSSAKVRCDHDESDGLLLGLSLYVVPSGPTVEDKGAISSGCSGYARQECYFLLPVEHDDLERHVSVLLAGVRRSNCRHHQNL